MGRERETLSGSVFATSWQSAWELEFGRNDAEMIRTFLVFLAVFFVGITNYSLCFRIGALPRIALILYYFLDTQGNFSSARPYYFEGHL